MLNLTIHLNLDKIFKIATYLGQVMHKQTSICIIFVTIFVLQATALSSEKFDDSSKVSLIREIYLVELKDCIY